MRIVAWNVAHATREKVIGPDLLHAVVDLRPDVLTLNEYVHGPSRSSFLAGLHKLGLHHVEISDRISVNNQVLVAARSPVLRGDLTGPATTDGAGASNFLHVHIPSTRMELVGLRAPAYERRGELRRYWDELSRIIAVSRGRRILFVGDFNVDPDRERYVGTPHLRQLEAAGWQLPRPTGPWSCETRGGRRSCIDHVLVAPAFASPLARYAHGSAEAWRVGNAPGALSDHTPLVVELDLGE